MQESQQVVTEAGSHQWRTQELRWAGAWAGELGGLLSNSAPVSTSEMKQETPEHPPPPTSLVRKIPLAAFMNSCGPQPLGLAAYLLGVSLLYLLCILGGDGTADKNRNCQRS